MITAEEPRVCATGRYNAKETAALLGVHVNSVRNYTAKGLLKAVYRRGTNQRLWLGSEIIRFWRAQY